MKLKKQDKRNITKVVTILGLIALCYIIFIDYRPQTYVELKGSFYKYEMVSSLTRKRRFHHHIYINEYPKLFSLEKNGKGYNRLNQYFKKVLPGTSVSLYIDENAINDTTHSRVVYKILVNDSTVFDRMQEDATVSKSISLIN